MKKIKAGENKEQGLPIGENAKFRCKDCGEKTSIFDLCDKCIKDKKE